MENLKKNTKITYFAIFSQGFRKLSNFDTLNFKGLKNDGINAIVTLNKGTKEYLLPLEQLKVLLLINGKIPTKKDLFVNGEDFEKYSKIDGVFKRNTKDEVLRQLTPLGAQIYNTGDEGEYFIENKSKGYE